MLQNVFIKKVFYQNKNKKKPQINKQKNLSI